MKGVMAMKDGKAWGEVYADGQCTVMGWVTPKDGRIGDPRYCLKPTDMTSINQQADYRELSTAKLVPVERIVTLTIDAG